MTCALTVVDMQNDFLVKDGYYYRRNTLHHDPKRLAKPRKRCRYIPITRAHRQFIDRVCKAVIAARARDWSVAFLRAVYSQTFDDRPSFLHLDRQRRDV